MTDSRQPGEPQHRRRYLQVLWAMILLTVIAFALVITGALPPVFIAAILLIFAAIQVALQVYLFMHLNVGRRAYGMFFGMGLGVAVLISMALFVLLRY